MALRIFGKKFNRMQTIAFFSAGAILWAILIIVIGVLNIREGDRRQTRSVTGIVNPESYPANFTGVAIIAKISNIDIPNFRYLVHFELFPIGNGLADPKDPLGRTPLVPLSITFDTQIRRFPASQAMSAQDLLFTITDGDTNMYPFDQFANQMNIFANIANNVSRSAAADTTPDGPAFTTSQPLPVAVSLGGALQAWSFTLGVNDTTTNIQTITTVFDRSFTVRFFSMFIIIVMWGLSLCTLALSSSVLVKSKEVPPQILALPITMLFALPNVRNAQPGVPGIGTTADVMGFMWNQMIIAFSAFVILSSYILQFVKKSPASPVASFTSAASLPYSNSLNPNRYSGARVNSFSSQSGSSVKKMQSGPQVVQVRQGHVRPPSSHSWRTYNNS